MPYNSEIIEPLAALPDFGQPGAIPRAVALWPDNDFLSAGGTDRDLLARKLGFLSLPFGWFRLNPPVARQVANICRATGSKLWIRVTPFSDTRPELNLYRHCQEDSLQFFDYQGQQRWFRCGDPREMWPVHLAWLEMARREATAIAYWAAGVQVHFHVDFECWESDRNEMPTLPEPLRVAIREKAWAVANILRQAVPDGVQEWNEKWGWVDRGPAGWQHSIQYPRPVASMPGDVVHTTMFLPGEPAYWEELARRTLATPLKPRDVPWVWHITLGLTPRVVHPWGLPPPLYGPVFGRDWSGPYLPERSWLLGAVLGGHKTHPRWAWNQQVSWISIENSLLAPEMKYLIESIEPWTVKQHWQAFVDGLRGQEYHDEV